MFEPIHGSAPKHAGKGVICPIATISAVQMMLAELPRVTGRVGQAGIDGALSDSLTSGEIKSRCRRT